MDTDRLNIKKNEANCIMIADRQGIRATGSAYMVKSISKSTKVLQAANEAELQKHLKSKTIHYLIIDINFSDKSIKELLRVIKQISPKVKILVTWGKHDNISDKKSRSWGVTGFLFIGLELETIKREFTNFMTNKIVSFELPADHEIDRLNAWIKLSKSERKVAHYLAMGYSNKQLCTMMGVSSSTISTLKTRLFNKLNLKNIKDLMLVVPLRTI